MVLLCSGCGQKGAGCRGKRLQREREAEKEKRHEATRPSSFSLAEFGVNGDQADWEKHEMDTWEGKEG